MARWSFREKYRKHTPLGRNSGTPGKAPQNSEKYTKRSYVAFGFFWGGGGEFRGIFWESRILGREVFFRLGVLDSLMFSLGTSFTETPLCLFYLILLILNV